MSHFELKKIVRITKVTPYAFEFVREKKRLNKYTSVINLKNSNKINSPTFSIKN